MLDKTTLVVYHVIMKAKKTKKEAWMSVKIDAPLKRKIGDMAAKERRSMADQIRFLIEKGLVAIQPPKAEAAQ
jgi:hypothetical protein